MMDSRRLYEMATGSAEDKRVAAVALVRRGDPLGTRLSLELECTDLDCPVGGVDGDGNGYGDGDGYGDGYSKLFPRGVHRDMVGKLAIVIGTYGWVTVGEVWDRGTVSGFDRGAVIERWGTSRGLGELQAQGPLTGTRLRAEGSVEWSRLGGEVRRLWIEDERAAGLWREALDKLHGEGG